MCVCMYVTQLSAKKAILESVEIHWLANCAGSEYVAQSAQIISSMLNARLRLCVFGRKIVCVWATKQQTTITTGVGWPL